MPRGGKGLRGCCWDLLLREKMQSTKKQRVGGFTLYIMRMTDLEREWEQWEVEGSPSGHKSPMSSYICMELLVGSRPCVSPAPQSDETSGGFAEFFFFGSLRSGGLLRLPNPDNDSSDGRERIIKVGNKGSSNAHIRHTVSPHLLSSLQPSSLAITLILGKEGSGLAHNKIRRKEAFTE